MSEELKVAPSEKVAIRTDQPILSLLEMAMKDSNVDLEKMDKIMGMIEKQEEKAAKKAFNADMAILQGEMPEISKDGKIKVNGVVRSEYAKYETIMTAIKPSLSKNGFSISFKPSFEKDQIKVQCSVSHREGHTETSEMILPADNSGNKTGEQK